MHYILDNWSFDPFIIVVAVVVAWHEIGLYRLAKRSRPERTRERRIRSLWFYAGLLVLLLAVDSPIDYWSDSYFMVHMVQHLLLMFAAPSLVVAGAPGQPLLDALPGRSGQAVTRSVLAGGWSRPVRAVFRFLTGPVVAVVLFNPVMVALAHPGGCSTWRQNNQLVHIWLDARVVLPGGRAVLAAVHPVAAVPVADAAARPGRGAACHQRRHDRHRDVAVDLRDPLGLRAVRPRAGRDAAARSPTSRSARPSCGCAGTSGRCPR